VSIEADIAAWDGKSSDDIHAIYNKHKNDAGFLLELTKHAQSASLQNGATWLIKQFVTNTSSIPGRDTQQILLLIPVLCGWKSKLHILQCMPYISIPTACSNMIESFVRECILDKNKFVRAWGYGGLYELARHFPQYREEAEKIMEMGLIDEPASVRARIRQITAQGF